MLVLLPLLVSVGGSSCRRALVVMAPMVVLLMVSVALAAELLRVQ